jgi:short-subunit dehydrogenase involved in D-alanine esterification of teichoic acids
LFKTQNKSSIINITTGLIYAPRAVYPIYNATKAALHSFTQVLRYQTSQLPIEIIEVMMPVVATPWHKGDVPKIAISPERAVSEMIPKIESGRKEIRIGKVQLLYVLSRIAPGFAFKKINQIS